jgi:hypothetical protein
VKHGFATGPVLLPRIMAATGLPCENSLRVLLLVNPKQMIARLRREPFEGETQTGAENRSRLKLIKMRKSFHLEMLEISAGDR